MDKTPDRHQPPTFDRTIVERISITPITDPRVSAREAVAAAEAKQAEAQRELDEAKLLESQLDSKLYMVETISPNWTPEVQAEIQREAQVVVATATHLKLQAQMSGATPEEAEEVFRSGLQSGAQTLGTIEHNRLLSLLAKYSRPTYNGLKVSQLQTMREGRSGLRDRSHLAGDREVGDSGSSSGSGMIFKD